MLLRRRLAAAPTASPACCWKAWTVTVLSIPMVIAAVALMPALMICPFLSMARQRLVLRLLARLRR
jgi:hypothetical protein